MAETASRHVLTEALWPAEGRRSGLSGRCSSGSASRADLAAQIRVPVWPSPVLMNLGTFAVLTIAAAYGPRLGLVTMAGWMLVGALGFDVFQSSTARTTASPTWRARPAATSSATCSPPSPSVSPPAAAGTAASAAWRRRSSPATSLIYVPGLLWLGYLIAGGMFDPAKYASVWDQTLAWGLTPFLIGDALKLALAALLVPGLWKLVGSARGLSLTPPPRGRRLRNIQ